MNKVITVLALFSIILLSACGNSSNNHNANHNAPNNSSGTSTQTVGEVSETITYPSENGPIQVPSEPKRIVALTNAPNILSLDSTLVGVDQWTYNNPLFTEKLEGVEIVSEEDLEKIIELEPDLIIAGTHMKNLDKLDQIAPTVVYTWGKLDYLNQQLEIGKLLNKEEEAQAWIDDFTQRAEAIGAEIKANNGENVTVSVLRRIPKASMSSEIIGQGEQKFYIKPWVCRCQKK
ncbi:Substrate-binding family protein [Marinicrinis lubricantis]